MRQCLGRPRLVDSWHGRLDRVRYGGVWAACAAWWRGWLWVEAVGLELRVGEAAARGELAEE